MTASVSPVPGGVVVVTHVYPAAQGAGHQHTKAFSEGRMLVLGTVQIVVGLVALLPGIVMSISPDTFGVYSGIFVWGAFCYITAGSLTVAAWNFQNRCLVNGALAVSVLSAVASFVAIILYSMDAAGILIQCWAIDNCYIYMVREQGFSGVLVVFHLLEFIVSITVAGFACCATCNCNTEPLSFYSSSADTSVTMNSPPTASATSASAAAAQPPLKILRDYKHPEEQRANGQTGSAVYDAVDA